MVEYQGINQIVLRFIHFVLPIVLILLRYLSVDSASSADMAVCFLLSQTVRYFN